MSCLSTVISSILNKSFVNALTISAPLVMDENKWEELSEVQTDYMDSARSEITDDTDISYITVSGKFLTKHSYPKNSDNGA